MKLLEAQDVTKVFGGGLLNKRQTVAVEGVSLAITEEKRRNLEPLGLTNIPR